MRKACISFVLIGGIACAAQTAEPEPSDVALFGTTVVIPAGLEGHIYFIRHNSHKLPKFEKLKSVGSIYATKLNIASREFTEGFPGVTNRVEWFAIDYSGKFWIETPGEYRFALTSDDGSKLFIDGQLAIDNDGLHPPRLEEGKATLARGIHTLRISYFQGPRYQVALVLQVARPGQDWATFDVDEFRPPAEAVLEKSGGLADSQP